VHGVNLSESLPDETIAQIRATLLQFRVIFFRDQALTPTQQVSFARRFGESVSMG
jgi:alpha-ketoglutarate-dependent taurine dioxygenase